MQHHSMHAMLIETQTLRLRLNFTRMTREVHAYQYSSVTIIGIRDRILDGFRTSLARVVAAELSWPTGFGFRIFGAYKDRQLLLDIQIRRIHCENRSDTQILHRDITAVG